MHCDEIQVNVDNIMEKGVKYLSNLKTSKGFAALYSPCSSSKMAISPVDLKYIREEQVMSIYKKLL